MPKKASTKQETYRVTLTMGDYVFDSEAETLLECLEKVQPDIVKCQAVIEVHKGTLSAALKLYPAHLRRMRVNKIYRQLLEKRLNAALH